MSGSGALHPRTGKAGGEEGEAGGKTRQEQGTEAGKSRAMYFHVQDKASVDGNDLVCACMEAREIVSAEKKLTDASLLNFICLDIKQDTTGK